MTAQIKLSAEIDSLKRIGFVSLIIYVREKSCWGIVLSGKYLSGKRPVREIPVTIH